MNFLITGGAGSVGQDLTASLLGKGPSPLHVIPARE